MGNSTNTDVISINPGATLSYLAGTQINGTNNTRNVAAKILGVGGAGTVNFGNCTFTGDAAALLNVGQANFSIGTYLFNNIAPGAQVIHTGTFAGVTTGTIGGAGTIEVITSFLWDSGVFNGNGSGTSSLLLDTTAILTISAGDRQTTNNYSIENRGTITHSVSPGQLIINGNYTQTSTGALNVAMVSVAGNAASDSITVSGNVTIAGTLNVTAGPGVPFVDGQVFTIINNTGANPIVGTFVGLIEGNTLAVGANRFIISYIGGTGNDMTLTALVFPVITIASPDPIVEGNVGNTNLVFTVSLSQPLILDVSVDYATASGTATSGVDFVPTSGTLVIAAGHTSGSIIVPVIGDLIPERNETFTVALSNPVRGTLGVPAIATGTIIDDDAPPQISFSQPVYAALEGGGSTTITVSRTNPSVPVSVNYSTSTDTATAGVDFTSTSGTLNFGAGVISLTFQVPILDPGISGGTRSFNVNLSNPHGGGATLDLATAQVTILDNDPPPPAISIGNAGVTEAIYGSIDAVFTVTLGSAVSVPLTVQFATADGTATAGADYVAESGTLTFAAGQTSAQVHVPVKSDFIQESDETFTVTLSNPSGGATLGTAVGTGTIQNQLVHTLTFDALHPYRYIDSSNNLATIMLKGPGVGTLNYLGEPSNDAKEIILNGTTTQSQLLVKTSRLDTFLVNLTVNGSMKSIIGPMLDLQGNLNVAGSLQRLRLNTILGGNSLTIQNTGPGANGFAGLAAVFGPVTNSTFTSAMPLTSLKVSSWSDADNGVDISAPSIGLLSSIGNFQADATLGGLGSLKVGGALDNSIIRVGGNINLVTARTMSDSTIFAGVLGSVSTLPTAASQFINTTSAVKKVSVSSTALDAFSNTLISAPVLGNLSLESITVLNGGTPFGAAGTSIASVRAKTFHAIKLTNANLVPGPFSEGDFVIRLTV